jgi:hypothetical protein
MLEHLRTFLGYCGQCGQPSLVGEFRLRGWKHVFTLCNTCLRKIYEATSGPAPPTEN